MKKIFSFLKNMVQGKDEKKSSNPAPLKKKTNNRPAPSPGPDPKPNSPKRPPRPKKKPWTLDKFDVAPQEGKTRFHDLDLPLNLMHAVADLKFEYCTDIQAQLLPHTLKGLDATAKAQTGTGKSATFIMTMIKRFQEIPSKNKTGFPRALILAPTRELVHQIEKDFNALAKYSRLNIVSVFGGTGYQKQQNQLTEKKVDVIAATPGRLLDFISKKLINLSKVEIIVLDEADRMLDMGFIPDVRRLVYMTPHKDKRQTLFFSATLTDEVLRLADSWTTQDRVRIEIDPEQAAADSIRQIVYLTTEDDKFKHVYNLITSEKLTRVIIFVNRKDTTTYLSSKFSRYGLKSSVLSGDVSQDKRFKVLNNFKNGKISILVATDVAARGLHIEGISHVINYDLPIEPEHYIHRIGRTGRAGAKGTSVSFADEMSSFQLPQIEEVLGHKIDCEYPSDALEQDLPKPSPRPKSKPGSGKKPYRKRRAPGKKPYKKPYSPKKGT
ncbi:DEAD/DEAH box helicase [Desulfospira joergensenii]|uniref:DEAD/DEAH box helicase n=1 Tax=Desulfospira joergensenii TaxID=53329 RepID=UPI0003B73136|nr:DEAD/DEAH box helicase [Desulfospira joergensenii]